MIDTVALREKVLDLAIRGKLVPQDPNDEPASVLLERIRAQKQQMVKEGKLKAKDIKDDSIIFVGEDNLHYEKFADGTVECIEDEIPFDIPDSWVWVRLGTLAQYKKGPFGSSITKSMFVPDSPSAIKVYEQKNAISKDASLGSYFISEEKYESLKGFEIFPNDIIVSCAGTIGETYVMPETMRKGIINQALMKISLHDLRIIDFYLIYFDCQLKNAAREQGHGVALKNIPPFDVLKKYLVPIPPIQEQTRIVDSVKDLLGTVSSIDMVKEELYASITSVKSKILDLAIRGKLVPQNPDDEPASVLLERIKAEKEELIRQGKIKRDKKESVIFKGEDNSYYEKIGNQTLCIDAEIPFELPPAWVWCRGYSCFSGMETKRPDGESFRYIDIDSIDNKAHKIKQPKVIAAKDAPSRASRAVQAGSVLFSFVRPYLENIAYVNSDNKDCIASTGFYVCNSNGILYPPFMYFLMISEYVVQGLNQFMKGDNSPSISKDNIENWLYPIPPINEQKLICTKLEELISFISTIEKSLS